MVTASYTEYKVWPKNYYFGEYMKDNNISYDFLDDISNEDLAFLSEIQGGTNYFELRNNGRLAQTLIPIGEEMQIHIYKDLKTSAFKFDIIPVIYKEIDDEVLIEIDRNVKKDFSHKLKNPTLEPLVKKLYEDSVKLSRLKSGDKISLLYTQKSRLGKAIGQPIIKAIALEYEGKTRYLFKDEDDIYHNNTFKKIAYTQDKKIVASRSKYFIRPLNKMRITSKFTYKRWHPVLKRYRPHLGVDLGAKRGTPIHVTNDGKVVFAGWLGGYGKVIKVKHADGYLSLYAHQSRLNSKRGRKVKSGQVIGYVGSTGRSTGPHLHFGLYKNGRPVNPMKYIGKRKIGIDKTIVKKLTKYRIVKIKAAKNSKKTLQKILSGDEQGFVFEMYKKPYGLVSITR